MLETLNSIDISLFYFLNVTISNPLTDFLMPIITNNNFLRIGYALAMILILWKGDASLRWAIIFSALVLVGADQLSATFLKPWIGRLRPCHTLEGINLLVGCGGGKAMPSSHAANAFGQALLFGLLFKRSFYPLLITAFLVAISRIFVGVHYPGDVLVGSILGASIGVIFVIIYKKYAHLLPGMIKRNNGD